MSRDTTRNSSQPDERAFVAIVVALLVALSGAAGYGLCALRCRSCGVAAVRWLPSGDCEARCAP